MRHFYIGQIRHYHIGVTPPRRPLPKHNPYNKINIMEIPPHETSHQQSLELRIENLKDKTDKKSLQERYNTRVKLCLMKKGNKVDAILDELTLINNQQEKNPNSLPELSDQRITLIAEKNQMPDPSLTLEKALTEARQTELNYLQERLTIMTELDNSLFKNKSLNNNTAGFKENIKITRGQIEKIQKTTTTRPYYSSQSAKNTNKI